MQALPHQSTPIPPLKKTKKRKKKASHTQPRAAAIEIYTDGGCWSNPGDGGWGAVIIMPDGAVTELTGGEARNSTNNRMELMGPIMALECLPDGSRVTLFSDSQYVIKGITEWIHDWKRKGWINSQKKPVKNRELWERLDAAQKRHKVDFRWVPGHCGIAGNERADVLSQKGAIEACGHEIDFEKFRWK